MDILDRPIWSTLSTRHAQFAHGTARACRFDTDISPFASTMDDSDASIDELGRLLSAVDEVMLLQRDPIVVPGNAVVEQTGEGVQMVASTFTYSAPGSFVPVQLGTADVAEMIELATLTRPGPFRTRTHELGQFWGIREQGKLVAMAGERMKQPGYTEVSGVCSHPDFRGRGWARLLSAHVAARIVARGETPYLHAYASNDAAIQLYESLGFRLRCEVHVAVLKSAG